MEGRAGFRRSGGRDQKGGPGGDCLGRTGGQIIAGQNGEARNRKRKDPAGACRSVGRPRHDEPDLQRVRPGRRELAGEDGR